MTGFPKKLYRNEKIFEKYRLKILIDTMKTSWLISVVLCIFLLTTLIAAQPINISEEKSNVNVKDTSKRSPVSIPHVALTKSGEFNPSESIKKIDNFKDSVLRPPLKATDIGKRNIKSDWFGSIKHNHKRGNSEMGNISWFNPAYSSKRSYAPRPRCYYVLKCRDINDDDDYSDDYDSDEDLRTNNESTHSNITHKKKKNRKSDNRHNSHGKRNSDESDEYDDLIPSWMLRPSRREICCPYLKCEDTPPFY